MKLPIASEGAREILISFAVAGLWALVSIWLGWAVLAWGGLIVPVVVLGFFRDPARRPVAEPAVLLAPADGRVTHVERLDTEPTLGGPATRISIFLSIFDVHVNRAPCAGRVIDVRLRAGSYLDARDEASATANCCNSVSIAPDRPISGPILIRQIAGKVARRIVCNVRPSDRLQAGQKFGMIKFGSRTDLLIPQQPGLELLVEPGHKVYAGRSVLARIAVPAEPGVPVERPAPAAAGARA